MAAPRGWDARAGAETARIARAEPPIKRRAKPSKRRKRPRRIHGIDVSKTILPGGQAPATTGFPVLRDSLSLSLSLSEELTKSSDTTRDDALQHVPLSA